MKISTILWLILAGLIVLAGAGVTLYYGPDSGEGLVAGLVTIGVGIGIAFIPILAHTRR